MAQLKDLIVNGDARIIGKLYANQSMPDGVFHLANVGGTAAVTTSPYTSSKWYTTADDSRIAALYSGLTISLKIPVAGHSTYGTLLNVNGLGDHPVVYNVNSNISTRYAVGGTIILTYNATQTANAYNNSASATSFTGVWQLEDYDYDSTNIYQLRDNNANITVNSNAGALYRYQICLMNRDGQIIPYNNVSNATTTYTKALNTNSFDPFNPIYYYNSTTTVNAGSNASASVLYQHVNFDCRYSFNIQSDGTAETTALTAYKPVYIKATYNEATGLATLAPTSTSDTSYLNRSSIVQALPTTAPSNLNTIYIYLGRAASKYQIELDVNHPVYKWDSTNSICALFGGSGGESHSIEISRSLTSGTKIATFSLDEDDFDLYAPTPLSLGTTSSTAYRGDYGNTAYTHATDANRLTTAKAEGLYKIATTAHGHIKSATAIAKADITGLGIPGSDTNYYPTTWTWTAGTTSGPTASLTGSGMSAVSVAAIPAANGTTASGIVTTGAQTFGGVKTFSSAPKLSTNTITTSSGNTVTIPNTTSTLVNLSSSQALTNKTYNGYTLAAACAKAVVTSVDTSASLPTSGAVKTYVDAKPDTYSGTAAPENATGKNGDIYILI